MSNNRPRRVCNGRSAIVVLVSILGVAPAVLGQDRYLNLTWVDRSGDVLETIGAPGEYRGLDVSPDGRLVAVHAHSGSGGDVWIFEPGREGRLLVSDATGVQDNAHPIFSPDGMRVVYGSLRDGTFGLYMKTVDGRGDDELVHTSGRNMVPVSWSPDGRYIVYWENTGLEWVLPLEGDRTPFRLMDAPSSHSQISPDGKWVAYLAGNDVWVRAFPDGEKAWQVSTNNGFFPRWRGDSREIYYETNVSIGVVMAAGIRVAGDSIEVSEPRALFDSDYINLGHSGIYHTFAVSPDGERFLIPRPEPDTLVVVDRERNVPRDLGTDYYSVPTFSPDGSRIAAIRAQRSVWVLDASSGEGRQIAALDLPQAFALTLAWSPDGEAVAWLALDLGSGRDQLFLADADGGGEPASPIALPGIGGDLIGFAADGRSLLYHSPQLGGDVFFRVPVDGGQEATEVARAATGMLGPSLAPDGRYLAYHTDALNSKEVWVRPIDQATGELGAPVRVGEGLGMASWRGDGAELYYVGSGGAVMAASVQTAPALQIGEPRRLHDVPDGIPESAGFDFVAGASLDGGRVAFAVPPRIPPPALVEMRVVDRTGNVVATPGEAGRFFGRPMISTGGTKVAAGRADPEANLFELWAYDLAAGTSVRLVSDPDLNSWIWSDDGEDLIYVSMDFNDDAGGGIFRIAADGSGSSELVYRHYPGASFNLIDWSADGRFVLFNSGGVLDVLDLEGSGEAVELIREEFAVNQGLMSPDNRFVVFSSDETDANDAWLWSFDPDAVALGPASEKVQLSTDGSTGPLSWGRDGREVTFRNNGAIDSVSISVSGEISVEAPRVLFRQPEGAGDASASRNGERWVFFAPAVVVR